MRPIHCLFALTTLATAILVDALPARAQQWVRCASENGICVVPYDTTVRYGAGRSFASRPVAQGPIRCDNATFGDPAVGARKECQYRVQAEVSEHPTGRRIPCATEGGFCNFAGRARVFYGADDTYVHRIGFDGVECSNRIFGDPVPGVRKRCFVEQ